MAHLYMIYLLNLVIFRNYFNLPEGNILNCLKTGMVNMPLKPRLPLFLGVPKELIAMGSALHQMVFSCFFQAPAFLLPSGASGVLNVASTSGPMKLAGVPLLGNHP